MDLLSVPVKRGNHRRYLALIALAVVLSCGYTAGSLLPKHIKKIYIPTFENETTRYGIEQELTARVAEAFTADNRLLVVGESEADALLRGVIVEYAKGALTFDRAQTVDEFKVEIVVSVEFEDLREGKVLWKEPEFRAWESYSDTGDGPGEDDAVEAAINTLAVDMLSRTMEGW
ncbi:MAG: LptE family protein [bacterium]